MTTTTVTNGAKRVNPYGIDLTTGLKCALFTSTGTPPSATSTTYAVLAGVCTEASGTGYTTAGKALTGVAWSGTTSPIFTSNPISWTVATITFRYAVIYDIASGKIIRFTDFVTDQIVFTGTLTLTPDTDGLLKVTSS